MKPKLYLKQIIALLLMLVMLLSATGCDAYSINAFVLDGFNMAYTPGQKLPGSKWINSDLTGSIDGTTQLNLKDDFHTTVNREWILNTTVDAGEYISRLDSCDEVLQDQLLEIYRPASQEYLPDETIMTAQHLEHLEDLVLDMMDLAGNTEKRDALGVAPLQPYLEAIENIQSMDDLTAYLCNQAGPNFLQETMITPFVDTPLSTRDAYVVHLSTPQTMLLAAPSEYHSITGGSHRRLMTARDKMAEVLAQLGYSQKESHDLFYQCFWFEAGFAQELPRQIEASSGQYLKVVDNTYTLAELEQAQGNFPLTTVLEYKGLDHSNTFLLHHPLLLKKLDKLYTEKHLQDWKAYLLVHTVLEALPYLDSASKLPADITDDPVEEPETEEDQIRALAAEFVEPTLNEVVQQIYIGRHCTSQMKSDITKMVNDIRAYYFTLLENTPWLGDETRAEAIRKLENMSSHIMYPEKLTDYSGLDYAGYDEGGNLLDAVAAIRLFYAVPDSSMVNMPLDRNAWNLSVTSTIQVNAFYELNSNSIYIPVGILAGDFVYDADAPLEQNYGRIGLVVGHEITHAFDTSGYQYDADGLKNKWWTAEDEVAFRLRADALANYYNTLTYIPGDENTYSGSTVETEAIADMGGMKCMLGLAEKIPGFDYATFFTAYGQLFCHQNDLAMEISLSSDVHPLGFLRTNVTVQQFEEFYEAFDIGPGDGMYLAPENRIPVW